MFDNKKALEKLIEKREKAYPKVYSKCIKKIDNVIAKSINKGFREVWIITNKFKNPATTNCFGLYDYFDDCNFLDVNGLVADIKKNYEDFGFAVEDLDGDGFEISLTKKEFTNA